MPQASPTLNIMIAAARKAARALARDFGEVENLQVSRKGPSDFVSNADLKAEKTLFEELSKARPGYSFLMEERGAVEGTDKSHRWLVDPLDGTTNFLHGIPHFAVSIGLEREGVLVAGVVYNVVRDELFWAEKGAGAYLNDRRLRVAARSDLRDALFATGTPFHGKPGHDMFLREVEARHRQNARACAAGARLRSIWLTSRPGASTASGSAGSSPGTSPQAQCSCARPAASSASPTAATS